MKDKKGNIADILSQAQKQNQVPVASLFRNPNILSVLSKVIADNQNPPTRDNLGNRTQEVPNLYDIYNISRDKKQDINDAESVMQLLPDLELASQILISSILSPKDMQTVELVHQPSEKIAPPHVASLMVDCIKNYISDDYKIEARLPQMLADMLFYTGSHVVAIIPENSIDEIINNGVEQGGVSIEEFVEKSLKEKNFINDKFEIKNIGLLGSPTIKKQKNGKVATESFFTRKETAAHESNITFSLESLHDGELSGELKKTHGETVFKDSNYFTVTDNYAVLSIPYLLDKIRKPHIEATINSPSLENYDRISDKTIEDMIVRKINYRSEVVQRIKTSDQCFRSAIGEPLITKLPSEAVINVFVPGSPSEVIGHYILTDENGFAITRETEVDHYKNYTNPSNFGHGTMASALIEKANDMYNGSNINPFERVNFAAKAYGEIIESDLLNRLKNGVYGKSVNISKSTEIYRIMLSRALKQQQTRLIFIPSELMSYMAFKYDKNGIGRSLLDNLKVINSLAVHLMLADVRAGVLNSIPRTKVNVKFDEDTPDPVKLREQIMSEYFALKNSNSIPFNTSNPSEISDWANRSGVEFNFSGAKNIPDMDVDINEYSTSVPKSDNDLIEFLKQLRLNGVGLTPETLDAASGANFAASIVQESLLLARRAQQKQDEFLPQLTDHVRKLLLNSPRMINALKQIVLDNFDDVVKYLVPDQNTDTLDDVNKSNIATKIVKSFINKYELSLPRPDSLSIQQKQQAFSTYMNAIDEGIKYFISEEALPEEAIGENMQSAVEKLRSVIIAHYARKWMVENDYLPELNDLLSTDDQNNPKFDVYNTYNDYARKMAMSLGKMLEKLKPVADSANAVAETNELVSENSGSSYSYGDSNDEDDSDSDDEDDFSMDGDMSDGLDFNTDDDTNDEDKTDDNDDDDSFKIDDGKSDQDDDK
jgi:hypothetical protein